MDCSPPGSPVPGILQGRILEWVAISFSDYITVNLYHTVTCYSAKGWQPCTGRAVCHGCCVCMGVGSSTRTEAGRCTAQRKIKVHRLNFKYIILCVNHSVVSDSAIPWTGACQVPLSIEFSRQEYPRGLPFPSPGGLPDPGIELRSSALQTDSLPSGPQGKPKYICYTAMTSVFSVRASSL